MRENVMIIVAHPDDEVLGMGGTIQKLVNNGNIVDILLLSKPGNARGNGEGEKRTNDFKNVCNKLGISNMYFANFPDNSFDSINLLDIIKKIEETLDLIKPKIVFTHFYNDLNIDHSIVAKAVLTALRPFSKFSFVKKIFMFEVLSSTELAIGSDVFVPNYFEDIEKYIEGKKEIFSLYETEIRDFPHPRSLEGIDTLTKFRGMQCGKKFAEGFLLYKSIN